MKKIFNILFGHKSKSKNDNAIDRNNKTETSTIVAQNKNIIVGDWCKVFSDKLSIHPEDRHVWENYPYNNEYHLCINVENGFYRVRFSGLSMRVLRRGLIKVNEPEFFPFEQINYITTKGQLEFGRIIGYTSYYKPKAERAYIIKVKDRIKSNWYRAERLSKSSIPYDRIEFNEKLSKTISYSLRHKPDEFDITLDENGWADLELLIENISIKDKYFKELSLYDVSLMIDHSIKKRHELKPIKKEYDKKWLGHYYVWQIRAKYGHSLETRMNYGISEPPEILYHGTDSKVVDSIMKNGLKPMTRAYVHLSTDKDTAKKVGLRKSDDMTILKILAKEAFNNGQNFYKVDSNIWLTDKIRTKFIVNEHDH